jgi:hypothetical protein
VASAGYATLDVIPSVKGTRASIERQISGDFAAAGRTGGRKMGEAAGAEAATSLRGRMSAGLKGFAPFAGIAAGAGVVAGLKDAIGGASDLAESTSKANVVFGDASASVLRFADDAATGMGQAQAQALEAAGTFGNLLRSVGLSEKQAADFSTTMVGLASDLASFNNTSVDDALVALRAGLVGETEPLKRFGVNLNDATLKAEALKLGLSDGKSVLDANTKAQAAYSLIMKQTVLAQGDFARTSGGLANQNKILGAQWTELTTSLGTGVLPATTALVTLLNDEGIPALRATGGAVGDAVGFFNDLPGPVKAATGALVAFKIASALGAGSVFTAGRSGATRLLDDIRLRAMLATDAYKGLRSATIQAEAQGYRFNQGSGRIVSGLGAVQSAAAGAGSALKRGLGGALGIVGGPWGLAFAAGVTVLTHFWQEAREAKARVEALTDSLDKQTGAITQQTRDLAFQQLQQSGVIETAKKYGVALDDLVGASLGNEDAQRRVNAALQVQSEIFKENAVDQRRAADGTFFAQRSVKALTDAISGQNGELDEARSKQRDYAEAMSLSSDETERTVVKIRDYDKALDRAEDAIRKLIDAEQTRADNAVRNRRDQLGLITTLQDARKEANKGKQTLDENTRAGQENLGALLDLADQWNNSSPKVQNARGAYKDLRDEFIKLADQMNGPDGTRKDAIKLADSLLAVPKNVEVKFQSKGYRERMNEIAALKLAAQGITMTTDFDPLRPDKPTPTTRTSSRPSTGGVTIQNQYVTAHDYKDFVQQSQRRTRAAASDGMPQ